MNVRYYSLSDRCRTRSCFGILRVWETTASAGKGVFVRVYLGSKISQNVIYPSVVQLALSQGLRELPERHIWVLLKQRFSLEGAKSFSELPLSTVVREIEKTNGVSWQDNLYIKELESMHSLVCCANKLDCDGLLNVLKYHKTLKKREGVIKND